MNKIVPNLWFDRQALDAANFYVSLFEDGELGRVLYYNEEAAKVAGLPVGLELTVEFKLHGQDFVALNGGPEFKFNEAVSLMVECKDQAEIDHLWDALSRGGQQQPCGWLKDKYGLSWQIVPAKLRELLRDEDKNKVDRVMSALMKMTKIDLSVLEHAYEGRMVESKS
jgi:predicted 3-demethylubiquinone-9 3-methyltransferase (glyoxalase superfamily)